jgi:hypothetical protein
VRDNGKGINASVQECRPDCIGVGIGGMRQRVNEFGGHLRLENCNPGTLVEVKIPTGARVQEVHAAPTHAAPTKDRVPAEPAMPSSQEISPQLAAPRAASVIPASISPAVSKDAANGAIASRLPL